MYSKIDNIEQFWSEKLGLGPHYTPIQAPVGPLIGTASTKIDDFKFKIWNQHKKLSEIESSLAVLSQFLQNFHFQRPQTAKMHFWGVRQMGVVRS